METNKQTIDNQNKIETDMERFAKMGALLRTRDRSFVDFILDVLTVDPRNRPSASQLLSHPFFASLGAPAAFEDRVRFRCSSSVSSPSKSAIKDESTRATITEVPSKETQIAPEEEQQRDKAEKAAKIDNRKSGFKEDIFKREVGAEIPEKAPQDVEVTDHNSASPSLLRKRRKKLQFSEEKQEVGEKNTIIKPKNGETRSLSVSGLPLESASRKKGIEGRISLFKGITGKNGSALVSSKGRRGEEAVKTKSKKQNGIEQYKRLSHEASCESESSVGEQD